MRDAEAIEEVQRRLAELIERPDAKFEREKVVPSAAGYQRVDLWVEAPPHRWLVEWTGNGAAAPVASALEELRRYQQHFRDERPLLLLAVPFMGEKGRQLCEAAGVSWLDLAGNARLRAPGLLVHIEGHPPRVKRAGRPENPFASRSARITRRLLLEPARFFSQRELTRLTGLGEGFVSRIVRKLEADGLLRRDPQGRVRPHSPDLLLDSWSERYDFLKHRVLKGHIVARSPESLLRSLGESLDAVGVEHAATGLAAAWQFTHFAAFRTVTVFLREAPGGLLEELDFREEPRGANVWLVVPDDAGVFERAAAVDGVRCVSAVQAYVDLKAHPERAAEAAQQLRRECLKWSPHD